jgi:outer membrane protein assembly factor BamB
MDAQVASSGLIVLANEDAVLIADGFSGDATHRVTAVSALTGGTIWQREDIVADDVFLQAVVGDLLLVNGQFDTLVAVNAADGATVWSFQLPELYGVVSSVVDGDQVIVAAEAPMEGDERAPLVFGLGLADGSERWSTSLAEGTDLQWASLAVADDLVFVAATPSHPGVGGNTLHALDTATGETRWVFDGGGVQGFHTYPVLVQGDIVAFWAPEDVLIGLEVATGQEMWRLPGSQPLLADPSGSIYAASSAGLQRVDISAGTQMVVSESVVDFPVSSAIALDDRQLVVAGRLGLSAVDTESGDILWHWNDTPLVEGRIATVDGLVIAPTSDGGVVAIRIPQSR